VNAGRPPGSARRPALTAYFAVNAGHSPDQQSRPALTGGPVLPSMPLLT
jgi:hypothetical protein